MKSVVRMVDMRRRFLTSPQEALLWTRNIEISGVPTEIALVLQKEQPIRFSGTIARIDRFFGENRKILMIVQTGRNVCRH